MTDILVIGGGPAGATAAIYTARAGLETVLVHRNLGALEKAESVENFYGFAKISGKALVNRGLRQARSCGVSVIKAEVVGVLKTEKGFIAQTSKGAFESRAVLLATGANRRAPNIKGLSRFEGHGVSHCAICDGFFYRGKNVAVLGSGEYALSEVNDLLPLAASVTLLTNGGEPSVKFPKSVTVIKDKISELTGTKPEVVSGIGLKISAAEVLSAVVFESGETLSVSGLFIAVGIAGGTDLAVKIGAELTPDGSVKTAADMQTSVRGLWAAGDCAGGLKQIAKAVHEGAEAGLGIINFLRNQSVRGEV